MMDPTLAAKAVRFLGYQPEPMSLDLEDPQQSQDFVEKVNLELQRIADVINALTPAYGELHRVTPQTGGTASATPAAIQFDAVHLGANAETGIQCTIPSTMAPKKIRGIFLCAWWVDVEVDSTVPYTFDLYINGVANNEPHTHQVSGRTDFHLMQNTLLELKEGDEVQIRVSVPGPGTSTFNIEAGSFILLRIA